MTELLERPRPQPAPRHAPPPPPPPPPPPHSRRFLLRDLDHPSQLIAHLTPNWYASIMGTAIVAVAAAGLPEQFPGLRAAATAVWAMAAVLLIALTAATILHWVRHPATARSHAANPVMAHFYGAPPMAMLAVGAATLLLGRDVIGMRAAIDADWTLWFAGTATGLLSAAAIPYRAFTEHETRPDSAFGGWLMPVVPPMVSASTGALLAPYCAPGQVRLTLVLCCYAMFGMSLLASIVIITLIWQRLTLYKTGPARMVPTVWIVLGPLGQSVTAANLLGAAAKQSLPNLPAPYGTALEAFGVVYGVPVWGFAMLWASIAAAITVRTARASAGLPFSLTWWSFTFPVGTVVTGTSALAQHTGADIFRIAASALFAALVLAWVTVAARTARDSLRGRLFLPPETSSVRPVA